MKYRIDTGHVWIKQDEKNKEFFYKLKLACV